MSEWTCGLHTTYHSYLSSPDVKYNENIDLGMAIVVGNKQFCHFAVGYSMHDCSSPQIPSYVGYNKGFYCDSLSIKFIPYSQQTNKYPHLSWYWGA